MRSIKFVATTTVFLLPLAVNAQENFPAGVTISDNDFGQADLFVTDTTVLDGNVCIGNVCSSSEVFDSPVLLKLSHVNTFIDFIDGSSATFPDRDWRLRVNDSVNNASGGLERFSVEDLTAGTIPFTITGGAPENSVYVASSGQVAFGTSVPQADLHVASAGTADLRLGPTDLGVRAFDLSVDEDGFFARISTGAVPFEIAQDSAFGALQILNSGVRVNAGNFAKDFQIGSDVTDFAMFVDGSTGFVGFGTNTPEELLHIRTDAADTDAFALFDANGPGSDSSFRLRQNGVTPTTWEFRNQQDSGRLNVGLAGGNTPFKIDNAANNNLLRLGRNGQPGEVNITGTLVVNNTALNVPDYVFADDYALRPLAEVRDFITANSHLPDVPSEAEIKANGVDMTAMQMTLLKKVEELTLYTLQQDARLARMDALEQKIARLEALLAQQ